MNFIKNVNLRINGKENAFNIKIKEHNSHNIVIGESIDEG